MFEVQASCGNNCLSPMLNSTLALNTSAPSSFHTVAHPLGMSKDKGNQTASAPALALTSSTAPAVKHHKTAKQGATAATNGTANKSGKTGTLAEQTGCGGIFKRSWIIKGRVVAYLHVREQQECVAPVSLEPATALVPEFELVPESKSKTKSTSLPEPTSSPEPQAEQESQQTDSQQTNSQQTDSQQTDSQTDSQQTDSEQTDSQTDSQQTSSQAAKGTPQVDSQPAEDTTQVESEAAKGTPQVGSQAAEDNAQVEPEAAKETPQVVSQAAEDTAPVESEAAKETPQVDSQAAEDTAPVESEAAKTAPQVDSQEAEDTAQVESEAAEETPQVDSQAAEDTAQVNSQPAAPAIAPTPTTAPVIVQGQTVPANGEPITVNNQPVKVSSGYIYVGSSSTPIPIAQAIQSHVEPIVAGTLTFQPASSSPVPQVAPSPVVVGGLTFSAPQLEPSVESDSASDQAQAQPVVVGGKTYAPVASTSQPGASQAGANTPEQIDSEPSATQQQSNNAADNDNTEPDQVSSQLGQSDSKPIVIGGITYTPVATTLTPGPQSAAVFSFGGTALTQGGEAVTISGTRISLGPSGVVIGTSSLSFSTLVPTIGPSGVIIGTSGSPSSTPAPTTSLLAVGSQTLTALRGSEGGFEIGHSTLLPGSSAVVISGTTYSINEADSLIVGTSTIPLATAGSIDTSNGALTADGETFTPLGSTAVVVGGSTLSIGGPAITEDGKKFSLASNGLLVGSSTFAYATPVANTATVTTASSAFGTGASASGGVLPTTFPSVTGGKGKSAASAKTITFRAITTWFGISMSLLIVLGIL